MLIAGGRGIDPISGRVIEIFDDPNRQFATSPFVRLEILPKSLYYRKDKESQFYRGYFDNVSYWADDLEAIFNQAELIAEKYGISAMDALHIAAAILLKADDFITTERTTKPMFRVMEIKIVSLITPNL